MEDQFTINRAINLTKTIATIYRISVTERLIKFRKQSPDHSDRFTSFAVNVFHLASSSTSPQQPAGRYRDTRHTARATAIMMMSKSRAAAPRVPGKSAGDSGVKIPELAEFLEKRDYVGATTLLEHKCQSNPGDVTNLEWLAYSHFHGGDPQRALDTYIELLRASDDPDPTYHVFAAACLFYLGRYEEAEEKAARGQTRSFKRAFCFTVRTNVTTRPS